MSPSARDQARSAAIRALTSVLSDGCTLEDAFARAGTETGLGADQLAGWLQDVASGTLRWKGRLDLAIDAGALKKKPSGWLRKALLIAAYQLIAQERANPGAVVSETVDLVRAREGEAPARFANALLRKVASHAADWRSLEIAADVGGRASGTEVGQSGRGSDSVGSNAASASLPPWLWAAFVRDHGREWAWNYARASLERPVTWLRARDADWRPAAQARAEPGPVPGSWRLPEGSGAVPQLAGFAEGAFIVQDISSQLLIANVTSEIRKLLGPGPLRALDLCAAPGGKSVGLRWSGFEVSSTDRGGARLALLRDTLRRVQLENEITCVAREKVSELPAQDVVWVDAPCSGSGILRRHPEVRWIRQEKELASLLKVQAELLAEAWTRVRPGGMLAYSVCSVLRDEGPRQLERLPGPAAEKLGEWLLEPQSAPHGDGFWAALVRKPEE